MNAEFVEDRRCALDDDQGAAFGPKLEHLGGVSWRDAPVPRRAHKCQVQTRGWMGPYGMDLVERCACGAIRMSPFDHAWMERNSRRGSSLLGRMRRKATAPRRASGKDFMW